MVQGADSNDSDSYSNYGAEFREVLDSSPQNEPWEFLINTRIERPWLKNAMFHERTFMNIQKALNEPPVKTYRNLKFNAIPSQYEEVPKEYSLPKPVIKHDTTIYWLIFALIVILLVKKLRY